LGDKNKWRDMNWMLDNSHKVEVSSEEEGEEKA
jgi:hypothetical protein